MFTRSFSTRDEFAAIWPRSVDAMADLYERSMVMPDYRDELSRDALQRTRVHAAPNEIEWAIRRLWTIPRGPDQRRQVGLQVNRLRAGLPGAKFHGDRTASDLLCATPRGICCA